MLICTFVFKLTGVFRKTDCKGRLADFLLKEILLVQEENDRGIGEPLVVADRVEQLQALLHSVLQKNACIQ